jgi:hypothetical protein
VGQCNLAEKFAQITLIGAAQQLFIVGAAMILKASQVLLKQELCKRRLS